MKISIIIPVYNASKYLSECLDSILNQTLKDFEIICVDDGSSDNSPVILEEYSKKDKRIRVFHQKNQYAGVARNNGLKHAKGEYVLFLDSDDFFENTLCEKCYERAKETNADIVVYNSRIYDDPNDQFIDSSFVTMKASSFPPVFNVRDIPNRIYNFASTGPCNKFYKRSFLVSSGIEFSNLQNAEDVYFTMMTFTLADRICLLDDVLYNYRVGLSSNLQSLSTHQDAVIYAYRSVYDELQKLGLYAKVEDSFVNAALSSICYNLNAMADKNRGIFYKTLNSPVFLDMKLLDYPESYYSNKGNYYRVAASLLRARYLENRDKKVKYEIVQESASKEYKVSVIVPIYNVELYLEECLDSLINQTLKDIEIVCVNDASTDSSYEIAKRYAKADKRIKLINHLTNGGLSIARNSGLKESKGEYIYFLDSDDYIDLEALEKCYDLAKKNNLDCVYFNPNLLIDGDVEKSIVDMHRKYYEKKHQYPKISKGIDLFVDCWKHSEYSVSACMQITKREFLFENDLFFLEGIVHEDEPFYLMALVLAEKVGYINKAYYQRRLRPCSIMTVKKQFKNSYGNFISYNELRCRIGQVNAFTEEQNRLINDKIHWILEASRSVYKKLSKQERKKYLELNELERKLFKWQVVNATSGFTYRRRSLVKKLKNSCFNGIIQKIVSIKKRIVIKFSSRQ